MKSKLITSIILALTTLPAFAETCESSIAAYLHHHVAVVQPDQTDAGPSANNEQSMMLFAQGYEQCQNGLQEQGMATINQAIALLNAQ